MSLTQLDGVDMTDARSLRAAGRAHRSVLPRSAHGDYAEATGRDPLGIITTQNADRLPELVGLRAERMRESAFTFYRGTASVQAADLAGGPSTGVHVVISGDAHLSNFGFYRSPQRTLVFDMNDFDEAAVAPWEWDVKRLVASIVVAARACGASEASARFRDGNSSVEVETLDEDGFRWYARTCAWVLARGHAQSPALPFIAGYLGASDAFDRAVARWAVAYADQAERDDAAFVAATT